MDNFGSMMLGGKYLKEVQGAAPGSAAVAAGAGDNTWVNGPIIDRAAAGDGNGPYEGITAIGIVSAVLATSETCAVHLRVQHDDDPAGATMADYTDEYGNGGDGATAITTIADGADETGLAKLVMSLKGAKQYVRIGMKVNLSASGTDTADFAAVGVLTGARKQPQA